ncbi:MAG TPA: glycosyltransferase family 2 protein [Candidatus Bathyarchaeia archaeon]|nr:glycosyltransferase family 2 protein [Candidatus Bathyarchaeia archaeon]
MEKLKSISVFFPAYNEEGNIESVVAKTLEILPKIAQEWEILIINDGSTDRTGAVADQLAIRNKRIRVIHHQTNQGYGSGLKEGFYGSRFGLIAFTDADGQFDFSEISQFLETKKKTGADIVIGYRINRQDSFVRQLFGRGWTFLANFLLGIKVKDVDCGFKLVDKKVIDSIPRLISVRGGMISPELLAKAKKAGFKIAEVGVHHYPRKRGRSTGADFKVIFKSFVDLGRLWWQLR